jgi:radical SAM protein with 4Fe4S-binding SPASM domain
MTNILTSEGERVRYIPLSRTVSAQAFLMGVILGSKKINAPFKLLRNSTLGDKPKLIWINAIVSDKCDDLAEQELESLVGDLEKSPTLITVNSEATIKRLPKALVQAAKAICLVGSVAEKSDNLIILGEGQSLQALCDSQPRMQVESQAELRFAKLLNYLSCFPEARVSSPVNYPLSAMVEVVRACNLACPLCPVGNGTASHHQNMSVDVFTDLIRKIAPTVFHLELYNYGEPLLHRQIAELVSAAKRNHIEWVEMTTNGTIMREGVAEGLVSAGLDMIRFAVDGASQETYERYRVGGVLESVWQNIARLLEVRNKLGRAKPQVEAQFIVNRFNEHEVHAFQERARSYGVDALKIKTFNALMSGKEFSEQGRAFLPKDSAQSRYANYDSLQFRDRYKLANCEWPWQRLVVNADGSIVPCCYDYNSCHSLGDFGDKSEHWWETERRTSFRQTLRSDPMSIDMCSICPVGIPNLDVHPEED